MTPLRILLVDDDESIGDLLATVLDDMGHLVCGLEATEAGAVAAALRDRPDLMIVDIRLRGGCGVAAVETICRTFAIPHIFMSGDRIAVKGSPAVVLQKPFMRRDLVSALDRTMGGARAG